MKRFAIEARLLTNGAKVTTTISAETMNDAELAAGKMFLEAGFKGDQIKIVSVEEQ